MTVQFSPLSQDGLDLLLHLRIMKIALYVKRDFTTELEP